MEWFLQDGGTGSKYVKFCGKCFSRNLISGNWHFLNFVLTQEILKNGNQSSVKQTVISRNIFSRNVKWSHFFMKFLSNMLVPNTASVDSLVSVLLLRRDGKITQPSLH